MTDQQNTESGGGFLPFAPTSVRRPAGESEGSGRSTGGLAGPAAAVIDGVVLPPDDGRAPEPRSESDDIRIATHESSHALAGRLLGQPIGGMTIVPADGFSGRCWGPEFESRFAGGQSTPSLCAQIDKLMPGPGEPRDAVADIVLHAHVRIVELCAGSIGEALFLEGPAWDAADDRKQERALASLVASSPEAAEAFIGFCRVEAAALLKPREYIVRALAAELRVKRTMDGAAIDRCIEKAVAIRAAEIEAQRRLDWRGRQASAASFAAHKLEKSNA
jgi:hypothetical protein